VEDLVSYFKVKKNLINLLLLAVLVVGLPVGINLARQQQILRSRAANNLAVDFLTKDLGGTDCVTTRGTGANNLVATCKDVKLRLTGGVSGLPVPSPSPTASTSPSPSPSAGQGNITASACTLGTAGGGADATHCKTTITWSESTASEPIRVYVSSPSNANNKTLVAEGRSGSVDPNWIPADGAVFYLYSGDNTTGTLLKSVTVTRQ